MYIIGRKNPLSAYMLKANRMPQKWRSLLILHLLVSTKNSFGSRSGLTFLANRAQHTLDLIWIQMVWYWRYSWFFCYFYEKGHFEENQKATLLKSHKINHACTDLFFLSWFLIFVILCFLNMWSQWFTLSIHALWFWLSFSSDILYT